VSSDFEFCYLPQVVLSHTRFSAPLRLDNFCFPLPL
jgi:hypothetical protein